MHRSLSTTFQLVGSLYVAIAHTRQVSRGDSEYQAQLHEARRLAATQRTLMREWTSSGQRAKETVRTREAQGRWRRIYGAVHKFSLMAPCAVATPPPPPKDYRHVPGYATELSLELL